MSEIIYFNGDFLPLKKVTISPNDRGFLLGDGLFETIRFDHNDALRFKQHWIRLSRGCQILDIPLPISENTAYQHIQKLLCKNSLDQKTACVRITISRGVGPRGLTPPPCASPNLWIQCTSLPKKKQASVSVMHSPVIINEHSPLRQFKSLNYAEFILARQNALQHGFDDALLYNTEGFLVSTTSANVFLMIDETLVTPSLKSGALPGITRAHLIIQAQQHNLPIKETLIRRSDCERAQAAFITNSLIQLTPIHQIEDRPLAETDEIYKRLIN